MIQRGFTTDGTGEKLTPFPCGPGGSGTDTDDQQATEVPYDNTGSGLTANDVQEAIDELAAQVAACCTPGGGQFSSGDLLSTGEVDEISGAGKQDQIYPDFVDPVNGDWAWINQGGASVTVNADGGILLLAPASATDNLRIRKKAAPSTPYTITVFIIPDLTSVQYLFCGIGWRQSSDGKVITVGVDVGTLISEIILSCRDWTNVTTLTSDNALRQHTLPHGGIWLQIAEDASNRYARWSADGSTFRQLFSEGRTTFLTADEVIVFANSRNSGQAAGVILKSYDEA